MWKLQLKLRNTNHKLLNQTLIRSIFGDAECLWQSLTLIYKLNSVGVSGDLLKLINNFLNNTFQQVLPNDQTTDFLPVKTGVPQGSISGPLFFLIYINDLPNNLVSSVKLFTDDTSLFSTVHDTDASRTPLDDLKKTLEWAFKLKMQFNSDPN